MHSSLSLIFLSNYSRIKVAILKVNCLNLCVRHQRYIRQGLLHTDLQPMYKLSVLTEPACPLHFEIGGTCTPCFSNWGYKPIFWGNTPSSMTTRLLALSPCWPALMTSWWAHSDFLCIPVHSGLVGLRCVFLFDLLWCSCIFFNLILSAIPRFVGFSL